MPTLGRPTMAMIGRASVRGAPCSSEPAAPPSPRHAARSARTSARASGSTGTTGTPSARDEIGRGEVVEEDALAVAQRHRRDQDGLAEIARRREVALDVLPGQQARHADGAAEELVGHADHARVRAPADADEPRPDAARRARRSRRSRGAPGASARRRRRRASQVVLEAAHEPDAVLGDREALVGRRRRAAGDRPADRPRRRGTRSGCRASARKRACQPARPWPPARAPRRRVSVRSAGSRSRWRVRPTGTIAVVATCGCSGASSRTVRSRCGAVVQSRAQHDLRVHPDAGLGQPLQPRQDLGRVPGLAEQRPAQRRDRWRARRRRAATAAARRSARTPPRRDR